MDDATLCATCVQEYLDKQDEPWSGISQGGAWKELVYQFTPSIRAAAVEIVSGTNCSARVEDIVQDVFIDLIEDDCLVLVKYDASRGGLKNYLATIAKRTAIDLWEAEKHRKPPRLDLDSVDYSDNCTVWAGVSGGASRGSQLLSTWDDPCMDDEDYDHCPEDHIPSWERER